MCTINRCRGRPFCAGGCPVPEGNSLCGETKTLDIINEFKRLYEEKMDEIDKSSCGDCSQEKMKLQQDWIGDLTEQNEMLVRAVEELEMEATERVKMLEDKLQKSAECICEVMKKYRENDVTSNLLEEPRRRIFNLENDVKNLLEFLRRIRDEDEWSTGGLNFYEITRTDLFGSKSEGNISYEGYLYNDTAKAKIKLKEQDSLIRNLEKKVAEMDSFSKELEAKRDECDTLQKNMIDMRQALTEEVATKHDIILKLKRECQELEDRCIQADKQTAFRDDIIKELRKEIKQLKVQLTSDEVTKLNKTIDVLQTTLEQGKVLHEEEEKTKNAEISTLNNNIKEMKSCVCGLQEQLKFIREENLTLHNKIKQLEQYIRDLEETAKNLENVAPLTDKIKGLECCLLELQSKSKVQTDAQDPTNEQLELLLNRDELIKYQSSTLEKMQQELEHRCKREKELLAQKELALSDKTLLQNKVFILEGKLDDAQKITELLSNKEDIIKNQKEALNLLQKEAETLRAKESEMRLENEQCCTCIQQLKNKINELENSVEAAERRANNLQTAVDLYTNTINVLEATDQKYKLEIEHQRTTIVNLQGALVIAKQEFDEYKQKYDDSVSPSWSSWFGLSETKVTNTNNTQKPVHDI